MNKKYKKKYRGKTFAGVRPARYVLGLPVWEIQVSDTRAYRIAHEGLRETAVRATISGYASPDDNVFRTLLID